MTTRQLTRGYRRSEIALRAALISEVVSLWPSFDPTDIDASWQRLEPAMLSLVRDGRRSSRSLAERYYRDVRAAQGVTGVAPLILPDEDWRAQAQTSLRVAGPVAAKQLVLRNRPDVGAQTMVRLSGALSRLTMNAGREYILDSVFSEDEAEIGRRAGWRRVTGGDPCDFCIMLAGRGAVYSRETAGFQAHDNCACVAEPDLTVQLSERSLLQRAGRMDRAERRLTV